jgi:hypothetical protein
MAQGHHQNLKKYISTCVPELSMIISRPSILEKMLKTKYAAGWDEDSCMITLDPEHYDDYIVVCNFCTSF